MLTQLGLNRDVTNPVGAIVKSQQIIEQTNGEFHGMIYREVVLAVLAIVGIILLARRRSTD